ncbi:Glycosylphosphatidylinositol:protein transamidase complex, GAA1 component [Eremomyces bilateralis CBS 781.70]|uniref:Glycosylphosphatidylinositol:protein transamidase complex, GAA1 component n=1 Tax=Eremomyces bilateralis CBS 781.70 TaxID=1392243 RepID=A0A6G1FRM1_9PEZI|nr:Glycosylphosphatidylinositol:protein transamidase complex, GAA1 component [Eremomyces bilateralis CBS 781.70]KAF1808495.1 Glycosylphosphatidylinositol:protein transamidase complex, GAA1 component [Eremomyces bilateralis CBS 781.70]
MSGLGSALLRLRKDDRILHLAPLISSICVVFGILWLLLLPLDEYSRNTYISENALLPGQVHTYFGGSEHNVFRAFRQEVAALGEVSEAERSAKLEELLLSSGLKVARQRYHYPGVDGSSGENVYAILQAPRGDATEAIVLIGAWTNTDEILNQSGVALVLTLARYFKRWSLWSKDVIFLISGDSTAGPQAWVDAYHDAHDHRYVESLTLKSGALQGAIAVDYPAGPWGHRFDKLHIVYDGVNGQLPNLDLINTAVSVSTGQMGVNVAFQHMWSHEDRYKDRLSTMLRGMVRQGLGHASGPHSAFMPYHVDAITFQTVGDGWHDEMSLGRTLESMFRSLNNLLEHLHQSFFFYLLMAPKRFVSIGTYLPSAMAVAGSFTVMSFALWVKSGRIQQDETESKNPVSQSEKPPAEKTSRPMKIDPKDPRSVPGTRNGTRKIFSPLIVLVAIHGLGLVPLYLFNSLEPQTLSSAFQLFTVITLPLPIIVAFIVAKIDPAPLQTLYIFHSVSLLAHGMALSALATLNFSLSLFVGCITSPLSFLRPLPRHALVAGCALTFWMVLSPMTVLLAGAWMWNAEIGGPQGIQGLLQQAAFGWKVHGLWTPVVVWLVWWPAWCVGGVVSASSMFLPA